MQRRAFTLIELLIVVAIIAILAAIAVPNFLEAQTRAKISRGLADMRSVATALESYKVDTNKYPPDYQFYQQGGGGGTTGQFANACLGRCTTPIAYMTAIPLNVFIFRDSWYDGDPRWYGYKSEDNWRTIVLPAFQSNPIAELQALDAHLRRSRPVAELGRVRDVWPEAAQPSQCTRRWPWLHL